MTGCQACKTRFHSSGLPCRLPVPGTVHGTFTAYYLQSGWDKATDSGIAPERIPRSTAIQTARKASLPTQRYRTVGRLGSRRTWAFYQPGFITKLLSYILFNLLKSSLLLWGNLSSSPTLAQLVEGRVYLPYLFPLQKPPKCCRQGSLPTYSTSLKALTASDWVRARQSWLNLAQTQKGAPQPWQSVASIKHFKQQLKHAGRLRTVTHAWSI